MPTKKDDLIIGQNSKTDEIPINQRSFTKGKNFLQVDCFEFLKINSSMTKTIEKKCSKTNFL